MIFRIALLVSSCTYLAACGQGAPTSPPNTQPQAATAPAAPTATPAAEAPSLPSLPDLLCVKGTTLQTGRSATGIEQRCEKDGVLHGPYRAYYLDGTRKADGVYLDNVPNERWTWWHPNGKRASKGRYDKGKQSGMWMWWHPNESRAQAGDFLAGRKAGKWTTWYEDGFRKEEGHYHNGSRHGDWTFFDETRRDRAQRIETWQNGILISTRDLGAAPEAPSTQATAPAAPDENAPTRKSSE